jgi:hypothetical protein
MKGADELGSLGEALADFRAGACSFAVCITRQCKTLPGKRRPEPDVA